MPGSGGLPSRHGFPSDCGGPTATHPPLAFTYEYWRIWKRVDYCVPVSGTGGAREGERTDKAHNLVIPERHRPWTGLADSLDDSGQAGMAAHVSAAQVTGRGYDMV